MSSGNISVVLTRSCVADCSRACQRADWLEHKPECAGIIALQVGCAMAHTQQVLDGCLLNHGLPCVEPPTAEYAAAHTAASGACVASRQ